MRTAISAGLATTALCTAHGQRSRANCERLRTAGHNAFPLSVQAASLVSLIDTPDGTQNRGQATTGEKDKITPVRTWTGVHMDRCVCLSKFNGCMTSMAAFNGGPRDAPGGSRKGGSAQLEKMHQPVPKGGSVREVLGARNNNVDAGSHAANAVKNRRWMGVVDEAPKRPVIAAWNPGGRAREGNARGVVARGPHLGFRKDYHKQGAAEFVRSDEVGVRPYRGVDAIRPDQIPVWEMKQPQKPGPWQNKYPMSHEQNGPNGPIQQGRVRIGADRVGPVLEFKHRRIDLRPHAQAHGKVDAHRIGVFPVWPLPPQDTDASKFDPDRRRTIPEDPEDRSRAAPAVLNSRRSTAVKRLFMALDPRATGKVVTYVVGS